MNATDSPEVLERFDAALDLVDMVATRVSRTIGPSFDRDDLIGYGREGLLDAARRFDPSHGVPFRAYAYYRVRGAMIDGVRQMASLPRRAYERLLALEAVTLAGEGEARYSLAPAGPADSAHDEGKLAEHLATIATGAAAAMAGSAKQAADSAAAVEAPNPEEAVATAELLDLLRRSVEELSGDQAEIIRRHYLEGESLGDIAKGLGMSKQWASRLHVSALARLTKRLRSRA